MNHKVLPFSLKSSSRSFTLIELIVVIIIVGILAAIGISQYSNLVEKSRLAEAKVHIGVMRNLAYQYYLEKGSLITMQYADVGDNNTCASTDFYRYWIDYFGPGVNLEAVRCTSGGKTPNASRGYIYYMHYYPGAVQSDWHCYYTDDSSPCFGLPN